MWESIMLAAGRPGNTAWRKDLWLARLEPDEFKVYRRCIRGGKPSKDDVFAE
jgi:hypothetical protein